MLTQAFSLRPERIFSPVRGTCREKETKSAARRRRRIVNERGWWGAEGLVETPQGKIRISNLIFQGIFNSVPTIPHQRDSAFFATVISSLLFHRSFFSLFNKEESNNLRFNLNLIRIPPPPFCCYSSLWLEKELDRWSKKKRNWNEYTRRILFLRKKFSYRVLEFSSNSIRDIRGKKIRSKKCAKLSPLSFKQGKRKIIAIFLREIRYPVQLAPILWLETWINFAEQ